MRSGFVQLSHIPHGLFEPQMRDYFSQFGKVAKVKLVRNKRTNRSKSVGFVQYADENDAKMAASAMNNYLMFDKILKCKFLSKDEIKPGALRWGKRKKSNPKRRALLAAERHNKPKTDAQVADLKSKMSAKLKKSNAKLKNLGIDYQFTLADAKGVKREVKKEEPIDVEFENSMLDQSGSNLGKISMYVDPDDEEIYFKTPPNVVKKVRNSTRTAAKISAYVVEPDVKVIDSSILSGAALKIKDGVEVKEEIVSEDDHPRGHLRRKSKRKQKVT